MDNNSSYNSPSAENSPSTIAFHSALSVHFGEEQEDRKGHHIKASSPVSTASHQIKDDVRNTTDNDNNVNGDDFDVREQINQKKQHLSYDSDISSSDSSSSYTSDDEVKNIKDHSYGHHPSKSLPNRQTVKFRMDTKDKPTPDSNLFLKVKTKLTSSLSENKNQNVAGTSLNKKDRKMSVDPLLTVLARKGIHTFDRISETHSGNLDSSEEDLAIGKKPEEMKSKSKFKKDLKQLLVHSSSGDESSNKVEPKKVKKKKSILEKASLFGPSSPLKQKFEKPATKPEVKESTTSQAINIAKLFTRRRSVSLQSKSTIVKPQPSISLTDEELKEVNEEAEDGKRIRLEEYEMENSFTTHSMFSMNTSARHREIRVKTNNKKIKELKDLHLIQVLTGCSFTSDRQSDERLNSYTNAIFSPSMFEAIQLDVPSATQGNKIGNNLHNTDNKAASGIRGAIFTMKVSMDNKYLAVAGEDCIVRVWKAPSKLKHGSHLKEEQDSFQKEMFSDLFPELPEQVFAGHTEPILDVSWSKHNFLASASLDKTIRIWHVEHDECLCCLLHPDVVTSINFHPYDDRFILSGCLDSRPRIWSLEEKKVYAWNELTSNACITAVAFNQNGNMAIIGTLQGDLLFYESENLKYNTQIHVAGNRPTKITGIESIPSMHESNYDDLILVTTTDSRVRLFNMKDKSLIRRFKGAEIRNSQTKAAFSKDGNYIICGSEDKYVYIWNSDPIQLYQMSNVMLNGSHGLGSSGRWNSFINWQEDSSRSSAYEKFSASEQGAITTAIFWRPNVPSIKESVGLGISEDPILEDEQHQESHSDKNSLKTNKINSPLEDMFIITGDVAGKIRIFSNSESVSQDTLRANALASLNTKTSPFRRTDTSRSKQGSECSNESIHEQADKKLHSHGSQSRLNVSSFFLKSKLSSKARTLGKFKSQSLDNFDNSY